MQNDKKKWVLLIGLALVWGSSFILMKKGLVGLSPLQMGSLRTVFTGIFLFIIGAFQLKTIPKDKWKWIAASGFCGTFFPAFLLAFAETEIDSSITSILNSLVPLFTLILGIFIFNLFITKSQIFGVLLGLSGTILLISENFSLHPDKNNYYSILVVITSLLYAVNVNIIKTKLQNLKPLQIAVGNFAIITPFAFIILIKSSFFNIEFLSTSTAQTSIGYIAILAIFGTALAKIYFNQLVQISSPVFASSVTYLIPLVAILWGILDGENLTSLQLVAFLIIAFGVYLVNKRKK
jgi:drug/metabolite transporter (DMT)-like permease